MPNIFFFRLKQPGTKKRKEARKKKNAAPKTCDANVHCDLGFPKTCDAQVQCDLDMKERICETRAEQLQREDFRLRPLVACHDEMVRVFRFYASASSPPLVAVGIAGPQQWARFRSQWARWTATARWKGR